MYNIHFYTFGFITNWSKHKVNTTKYLSYLFFPKQTEKQSALTK